LRDFGDDILQSGMGGGIQGQMTQGDFQREMHHGLTVEVRREDGNTVEKRVVEDSTLGCYNEHAFKEKCACIQFCWGGGGGGYFM
jgi:hypothetical protein